MTARSLLTASLVLIGFAMATPAQSPVPEGAKLQKIAANYIFTEGPAADPDGNVYFTDQPNDRIVKWSASDGKLTDWLKPAGRSNGLCISNDGKSLIACADDKNELWSIDLATKKHTVLIKDYQGKLLNGPNDVWQRPDGGIYFTDPLYAREYWTRDPKTQQDKEAVYFLPQGATAPIRVAEDLRQPNGIIGTPDGKTLYVADIAANKTYRYTIESDGKLSDKKLFCNLGSDGMTLDNAGNVYLTGKGGGVTIFDKQGAKVGQIDIKDGWTANVCFGGKDKDTLFITANKSVYTMKMNTKGAGSQ